MSNHPYQQLKESPTPYSRTLIVLMWVTDILVNISFLLTIFNVEPLNYLSDFVLVITILAVFVVFLLDRHIRRHR